MTTTLLAFQKQRRDTAANWTSVNPTLLAGEIGIESNTNKWKVGDGTTAWASLGYIPGLSISAYPLVNADIASNAEIAVSKLADGTPRQLLQTDAAGTGVEWASNIDVPGTLDVTGAATFDGSVTVQGDLTVNGTTTTIDTTNLVIEDKNIEIGKVATPTDVTADGGGITLKGSTDKTINWVDATDAWTFSEHVNIASAKEYRIAGTKVLDATSLGSAVVSSSLTSVGTIGTGTWQGTTIGVAYGGTGQTTYTDGQLLIGNSTGNTLAKATLTAGSGVSITNGNGSITISATGSGGTVTNVTGTSPITVANGTTTPAISIADGAIADTKLATISTAGKVSNSATTATSANTASAIVARDASGDFSAGTITATNFSGSGASLTSLTAGNLSGTIPSGVLGNSSLFLGTTSVALNRSSASQALTGISSVALPGSASGTITIQPAAVAGANTLTFPAVTGTVVTTGDTGSVTNTMLAGSIADTKLDTISTAGKVSNSATTATSSNTANAIVARDASGNFSAGVISDSAGNLRTLPQNSKTSGYTLIATDTGKHISITTGGVTIPSGVFSTGDVVSIFNNSGSNQTITQGSSTTVRQAGTANTGNRTLAQYGLATVLCVASNTFVISGSGLS